ncbi:MAG: hypothetical protein ACOYXT_23960 [Bacteroidota bacterium]
MISKLFLKKTMLLSVMVFMALILRSQDFRPGFVITANGDSLIGFVANRSARKNSEACLFKLTKTSEPGKYLPGQISGFGISGYKYFESKIIPTKGKKPMFVEVLVKGRLSLYNDRHVFYAEKDSIIYLLERPKRGKVNPRYIGVLAFLMGDCKQDIEKISYNVEDIANVVANYNNCKGSSQLIVKSNLASIMLNVMLLAGVDRSTVTLQGLEKFSYAKSISVPVGAGLRIGLPRLSDKFFGTLELFYEKKYYQVYDESIQNGALTRADFYVEYPYLKMPVGVHYNFFKRSGTPYVSGGFVHYFVFRLNGDVISETEVNGVVSKDVLDPIFVKKNGNGFWLGGGYQRQIGKIQSFIGCRYEVNTGFTNPIPDSKSRGNNLTVLVGLTF